MSDELRSWADRLEAAIERHRLRRVKRVMVMASVASTQDAARALCGGRGGLVVVAGRQTAGRGRFGRRWVAAGDHGVAMTFTLDAGAHEAGRLAVAGGLAACRAAEASVPRTARARIRLRWPNDVVVIESGAVGADAPSTLPPTRKLAGVLVERGVEVALVGIGVNVGQQANDWPADLADRVTSLRELGSGWSRVDVMERVMVEFDRALGLSAEALARQWTRRDVLVGRWCEFACGRSVVSGVVERVEPTGWIVLRVAGGGGLIQLDARASTLRAGGAAETGVTWCAEVGGCVEAGAGRARGGQASARGGRKEAMRAARSVASRGSSEPARQGSSSPGAGEPG